MKKLLTIFADLFTSGVGFANHFGTIFHPMGGEYDLIGKHPEAASTLRNVDSYTNIWEELRTAISPELELIESRITGPSKELQGVLKTIRKTITKREHKVSPLPMYHKGHANHRNL